MDFLKSMAIAASGLKAQSARMRVISENIANGLGGTRFSLLRHNSGKEALHRHFQCDRDPGEATGSNPIEPILVFLHLLKRNADGVAKLGL